MSSAKTKIDYEYVQSFLTSRGYDAGTLETITSGELSQAYFFKLGGNERVLRINADTDEGFRKDQFAAEHFASALVPIPKVDEIGKLGNGMHFAISERSPGNILNALNDQQDQVIPALIATLDAIHATPPAGNGWGWWVENGRGTARSWRRAIQTRLKAPYDQTIANVPYFDKTAYSKLLTEIETNFEYCPEERRLVHGDYGFDNALSDGTHITGVIDWHGSMYGDPLWDVAWLEFWRKERGYAAIFKQHYTANDRLPERYSERITCYQLIIGANALCFFARSGQPDKYTFAKQAIDAIAR